MTTDRQVSVGSLGVSLGLLATPAFGRVAVEIIWTGTSATFELRSPNGAVMASATPSAPGVYQLATWSDFPQCEAFGVATVPAMATVRMYYKRGF